MVLLVIVVLAFIGAVLVAWLKGNNRGKGKHR